jgi:hypothetical protein
VFSRSKRKPWQQARGRKWEPHSQGVVAPVVSTEGDELLAKLAWTIAHPARVRLLRLLIAKSACGCGELVELMPLSQSTVSQHLKILVNR